uniref:Dynein light chain n=1 Tax=Schistosoma japonicum TaxID=6182 RepID=Q5BS76_SCHJA|nr:SJCHGC05640 protein [Schistosoma japonicum]CAX70013.1 putative dynein light chain [Schistosoma japonicum]CAX70014.1 putative dynein light chain [Schistosoma japonicum]
MPFGKAVVKNADMDSIMQEEAVRTAASAREKFEVDKDIATYIKQHFDRSYGRTWHCIVGKQYGSDISHEERSFIYFFLGDRAILLFKSG